MLFLYRIQNDPGETSSYNAFQIEGNSLIEFAASLTQIFSQDFRSEFIWRLRRSDSTFGYIWKDVTEKEFQMELDGEMAMVRLLRLVTLIPSGERVPIKLIGRTSEFTKIPPIKVAENDTTKKKRAQQEKNLEESSNVEIKKAPTAPIFSNNNDKNIQEINSNNNDDDDDGLTPEERANIRIEQRQREEQAEMERKVQEVRDAEAQQVMSSDAKHVAWLELKPKLLNWSGPEANRKPIRTLLCTIQNILWEGSKWTPTSVIVRPNEVKLAYRKAMLLVHPDKIGASSPPAMQVIAKYCFENLNAAYEKFEAAELKTTGSG